MSLENILQKFAAKNDPTQIWQIWKNNKEHPDHFPPLLNHFQKDIKNTVNKFSANQYVSKFAIEKNVMDNFLKACQTYKPGEAALRTHVINYLQKTSRFVGDQSNTGYIPEPRRYLVGQYERSLGSLKESLGREPVLTEVVNHMNETMVSEGKKPVSVSTIQLLKSERKKDVHESQALNEAEIPEGGAEHTAILTMYHSTPVKAGEKHQYRLTPDEHIIFRNLFPLTEDGALDYKGALKPKQIALKTGYSQPKVSRSVKSIAKKLKNTITLLS